MQYIYNGKNSITKSQRDVNDFADDSIPNRINRMTQTIDVKSIYIKYVVTCLTTSLILLHR